MENTNYIISLIIVGSFALLSIIGLAGFLIIYLCRRLFCPEYRHRASPIPILPSNSNAVNPIPAMPESRARVIHPPSQTQPSPRIINMNVRLSTEESRNPSIIDEGGEERYNGKACCICLSRTPKIAAIPCGHLSLCDMRDCIRIANKKCPICRVPVSNYMGIFDP